MIRRIFFFLLFLAALLLFYKVDSALKNWLLRYTNGVKASFLQTFDMVRERADSFFDQSNKILAYKKELQQMQAQQLLYRDCEFRVAALLEYLQAPFAPKRYERKLTRLISYVRLGDFSEAWLEGAGEAGRIYGLVTPRGVAGIAQEEPGGLKAYFNGSKKCAYAVFVGDGVKGIATGSGDERYVLVKFIRNYEKIAVGDSVVTSGYDHIFPYGIEVGRVERIWQEGSYKVAKVRLAEDLRKPLYFWLIRPL